jgi:Phosphotransferase enzyme family
VSPVEHLALLEKFVVAVRSLIPSDAELQRPTLWHADLSSQNIFIATAGRPSLNCIIDWQSTQILPLYLQAQIPLFIQDDIEISEDMASQDPELVKIRID